MGPFFDEAEARAHNKARAAWLKAERKALRRVGVAKAVSIKTHDGRSRWTGETKARERRVLDLCRALDAARAAHCAGSVRLVKITETARHVEALAEMASGYFDLWRSREARAEGDAVADAALGLHHHCLTSWEEAVALLLALILDEAPPEGAA